MASKRPDPEDGGVPAKRMKTEDSDPKMNPYLAHMYEDQPEDSGYNTGYSNGYGHGNGVKLKYEGGSGMSTVFGKMPRHKTTAEMARRAEDGPNNAFSGQPLSKKYFNILKARRGLPVHAQRSVEQPRESRIELTMRI